MNKKVSVRKKRNLKRKKLPKLPLRVLDIVIKLKLSLIILLLYPLHLVE